MGLKSCFFVGALLLAVSLAPSAWAGPAVGEECDLGVIRVVGGLNKFFYSEKDGTPIASFSYGPVLPVSEVFVGRWDGLADNVTIRRDLGGGKFFVNTDFDAQAEDAWIFGVSSDKAMAGDVDGDGDADVAVVRDVGGGAAKVFFDTNDSGQVSEIAFQFGNFGDIHMLGRWAGTPTDYVALIRDIGGGHQWNLDTDGDKGVEVSYTFGAVATDEPRVADINGDGTDDPILLRTQGNNIRILSDTNGDGTPDDNFVFGLTTDEHHFCDADGDGDDDPIFARKENGQTRFYIDTTHDGNAEIVQGHGLDTDDSIVGDFDGM